MLLQATTTPVVNTVDGSETYNTYTYTHEKIIYTLVKLTRFALQVKLKTKMETELVIIGNLHDHQITDTFTKYALQ